MLTTPSSRSHSSSRFTEAEVLEQFEEPAGAGHDAVAAAAGEASGEQLEQTLPIRGAAVEGGVQHREFVSVGEES